MKTEDLGARIAFLRSERRMTGGELGRVLDLSKSQISKVENGTRKLDVSEVALVAEALGVSLAELLGVERRGGLALAARVMTAPADEADTMPARNRVREVLEVESALADAVGLAPAQMSESGEVALGKLRAEGLDAEVTQASGSRAAKIVREALGLGRAQIDDLPGLIERHFGLYALTWPVGTNVSGLCAHAADIAVVLVSSSFTPGHQQFTAAHELAHHLFGDPREVIIESDVFAVASPSETRANAFAAALLMPADGLLEVIAGRPVSPTVVAELMRTFKVSFKALIRRLAEAPVGALRPAEREQWLQSTADVVLREAGDPHPGELTRPDDTRRVPHRLHAAAIRGYQDGRVGLGTLSALLGTDADTLYAALAADGVRSPAVQDDLSDL